MCLFQLEPWAAPAQLPSGHLGLSPDPTEGTTAAITHLPPTGGGFHSGFSSFLFSLFCGLGWGRASFPSPLPLGLV